MAPREQALRGVDEEIEADNYVYGTVPEVVDPEVRAYVYSLVSALGGTGADEDGRYILGDDALACLKDLKRWLKLFDEKTNRLDVARCLAEANLVNGDLLGILASIPEEQMEDKAKAKISLACLELLVPLTWPIEKSDLQMTVNHHRHMPYLQLAQVGYKRGIINHDTTKILHRVVRIGLPSMAQSLSDRSNRDEGIIRFVIYFLRNIAMISVPASLRDEADESEVSRSATIEAFHDQDVLHLLLTMASGMGDEFKLQDVIVMETLFHLLKGVDIDKLFLTSTQREDRKTNDLEALMDKEAAMLRGYARHAPSRHNRFGTMIWLKRDDDRVSTISGQEALMNSQQSLAKMDKSKRWKKPRTGRRKTEPTQNDFDLPVPLNEIATTRLRVFVEDFLDSAFNPLFNHIRKAIEREAERVLDIHRRQFFYLISWFLEAERVRRKTVLAAFEERRRQYPTEPQPEADSFSIIASVLNQETFILLNRYMQESYDMKSWEDLNAGMRCFTQILLMVQEMSVSPLEEDQTIAENIQNRIFYEETTHDRIVAIVRCFSNQGFGYLNACTELAHVHLRMLDHYSKQNLDMQIRSRRRRRSKKKAKEITEGVRDPDENEDEGSEAEDVAQAQRTTTERKFDFKRFSAKFMTQACVDTFVALTRYYADLTPEQLKRAHRFFYRVAFKMEISVMLFRVDIIALFYKLTQGPEGLDTKSEQYREWDELVRQIFKKLVRKLQERPSLAVELLFSKINATTHFLEYGYEKQTTITKPRVVADLEVKPGMEAKDQIGVAVAILLDQTQHDALDWVKKTLESAISERRAWEAEASAMAAAEPALDDRTDQAERPQPPSIVIKPDSETRRIAAQKDTKLRLLMMLVGFNRPNVDEDDASWFISPSKSSNDLGNALEDVTRAEQNPPVFEDGKEAGDFVRRMGLPKPQKSAFEEDSENDGTIEDEEYQFPVGGPTIRRADALEALKKRRRSRQGQDDVEPIDEAAREARAIARQKADLERRRRIKSDLFIHDSDDEDDVEKDEMFFREEAHRRTINGKELGQVSRLTETFDEGTEDSEAEMDMSNSPSNMSTMAQQSRTALGDLNDVPNVQMPAKKRKADLDRLVSIKKQKHKQFGNGDEVLEIDSGSSSSQEQQRPIELSDGDDASVGTPSTSPPLQSSQGDLTQKTGSLVVDYKQATSEAPTAYKSIFNRSSDDDEADEEDDRPITRPVRNRVRAGFVIESDSD